MITSSFFPFHPQNSYLMGLLVSPCPVWCPIYNRNSINIGFLSSSPFFCPTPTPVRTKNIRAAGSDSPANSVLFFQMKEGCTERHRQAQRRVSLPSPSPYPPPGSPCPQSPSQGCQLRAQSSGFHLIGIVALLIL